MMMRTTRRLLFALILFTLSLSLGCAADEDARADEDASEAQGSAPATEPAQEAPWVGIDSSAAATGAPPVGQTERETGGWETRPKGRP